jgi:general secretion pathway protein D
MLAAGVAVWLGVLAVVPAHAQSEAAALERAIKLFDQGDYVASQELLVGVDRAKLNAKQQAARDDYLGRVQIAITMSEKAVRDFEDAETAMSENNRTQAERLAAAVIGNEYASPSLRRAATELQRQLQPQAPSAPTGAVQASTQPAQPPPPPSGAAAPPLKRSNGIDPADVERARSFTREGDEMVRSGRYTEAERRYEEALKLVPGYPEAVEGMQRAAQHRENVAGGQVETLIERIQRENQINWQRTVAEYRDAEALARTHAANNRFDEANEMVIRARQVVEAGRQFADPVEKYETLRAEADALADFVTNSERDYNEAKVAEIQREIERQREERIRQDRENRARQVEALMAQARQHRKDGDLDAAINVLQQVTVIDPKYQPARFAIDDLEDLRSYRRARDIRSDIYKNTRGALQDVEEAKVPWYMEITYPKNWPELIAGPERRRSSDSRESQLHGALEKPVPVDFHRQPLDQVIEQLADAHRLNIIVNWNDLQQAGVERTVPIDLDLPNEIALKRVLTEVLEQAGSAGGANLGFDVREGAVKVATRKTLDKETFTAVYDINDLLMEIPQFNDAPLADLNHVNKPQPAQPLAPLPWREGDDDDEVEEDPEFTGRVRDIINLIQDTVAPESWRDRGGSVGTIAEINGQLVITQNSSSQQQIGDLLGKLREQRAIQIAVEARFITVSSHYLEELGLDIDLVLNAGNAGYDYIPGAAGPVTDPVFGNALLLPRSFSRLGFTPNSPALGTANTTSPANGSIAQPFTQPYLVPQRQGGGGSQVTPVPMINRLSQFTDPSTLGSDVPGSFAGQTIGPALSVFGSFLDNIQVDFLLRATQADSRTSVLTAPRLVLFNGQRSWVAVTVQQSFVSSLNPQVAAGAVAQAPVTNTIDSGAVLDVNATVTADRRYVTMTVRPGVTRLLDLQTFPFSGGAAGGGFGGGPANQAFIQLPTLSSQRVSTTVSVPDGGTLLIGGQKLASETEVEAGVPILSKIPILKRAYSSRSMVKDEQTLLILIKPKILIQSEQEEQAFPAFAPGS